MKIEVKDYTYETMPDYSDQVEGMKEIKMDSNRGVHYIKDVIYDEINQLKLQILIPTSKEDEIFPCVCFIKGSAWKQQQLYLELPQLSKLAQKGYVVALIECRDSSRAHFPAHIIDAKNAIRYMKKNNYLYHVDTDKMFVMGDSSGGHTSAMIGCTYNTDLFDQPLYDETLQLKGCLDLYGAVEPTLEYGFPTTLDHGQVTSPEGMYLGYDLNENREEAQKADVKTYASLLNIPMLIIHGSKDKTVFAQESVNLFESLKNENKDVCFYLIRGADHGGPAFWSDECIDIYDSFIKYCLK